MTRVKINVPENLFESKFVSQNKPFSKIEAYIFLKVNGIHSINFFAKRFLWSRTKTKAFLINVEEIDYPNSDFRDED